MNAMKHPADKAERIVVTGAAGFIGSNLVKGLNARGIRDIIAVDDLRQGDKFRNLADLQIADYVDAQDFYEAFAAGHYGAVRAVFHEGACSDTTETDGQYMMRNNFEVSKSTYRSCASQGVQLIYASSAAVYGGAQSFKESPECERPLNVYGYSKLLFDQWVRQQTKHFMVDQTQVVGLRYFNVYGPREQHKGRMASVAFHHLQQLREASVVKLFGAHEGYEAGMQKRDFIYVDDVVAVNLWFLDCSFFSGIFNLGTGVAQPFNEVARAVIGDPSQGRIEYIDFPESLKGKYQSYTQADLTRLRGAGCEHVFCNVAEGIARYKQAGQDFLG